MVRNVSIKNLAEVAAAKLRRPEVFRPQKVNGKWRRAKWSARKIANERKRVIQSGGVWEWDIPKKEVVKRIPFKGHLRDLRRIERQEEIKRCMARMPKLIEDYRKNRPKKSKRVGLEALISQPRGTPIETAKKGKKN